MADKKPARPPAPERAANAPEVPEDRVAAARALYEGTPGMTIRMAAEAVGVNKSSLGRYAKAQNWSKVPPSAVTGPMVDEAQAVADKYNRKLEEFGPEVTTEQREVAVQELVRDTTVDARAAMLDRHRREWAAPRGMSAEAVRMRDTDPLKAFERAKMAKITAETLKIIQDGERKAHGIDVGELPPGSVVVIERA